MGWRLTDGHFLGLILFADNYWLVARNNQILTIMLRKWLELLRLWGWDTPSDELSFGTTAPDEQFFAVFYNEVAIRRVPRHIGFPALGCQITFDGRNSVEVTSRIGKCWRVFAKYAPILCNDSAPWAKRTLMLQLLIQNTLFWCSGSWLLSNKYLSKLKGVQSKMLRRMLCKVRKPGDDAEQYVLDCNRSIEHLKAKHKIVGWDIVAMRSHFAWAGYVSRLRHSSPERLTHRILKYRDAQWLRNTAAKNNGNQLHCRKLKVRRWEYPLVKWATYNACADWHDLAADARNWKSRLSDAAFFSGRTGKQHAHVKFVFVAVCLHFSGINFPMIA